MARPYALPYLKRIVQVLPPRRPGFEPKTSHVGFLAVKFYVMQVSSKYFGFTGNSHSTDYSTVIIIYHPGLVQ
jgi:hypothetical protein